MKLLLLFLSFITLNANEFPLIQPISVERSVSSTILPVKKEPVISKTPQKKTNTSTHTQKLKIDFLANSATIKKSALPVLEDLAKNLLHHKLYQAVIYGYTDSWGDKEKNRLLSQERANNVIQILEKMGVSSTRLTAIGMGKQNPIADNDTKEGREANRRIEALIIK